MKIVLDAMGGDNAPLSTVKGAVRFAQETKSEIILVGDKTRIMDILGEKYPTNISIVHTTQEIYMEDIPTKAIREKKDSSMVKSLTMVKNGEADVIVSAGNTGALLTGATLIIGRIKGINRPAVSAMLPYKNKQYMLLDAGANTNCKEENFMQFAEMATVYMRQVKGIENPKVGLLNIGTEETKGNELYKSVYMFMKENAEKHDINFIGNIEARDPFKGNVDIVLADGFTGNIFIKTVEGVGRYLKTSMKDFAKEIGILKIFLLPLANKLKNFIVSMDYKKLGGGLFLGVNNPVVKAHGSSDEESIYYTLKQAEDFARKEVIDVLKRKIEEQNRREEV